MLNQVILSFQGQQLLPDNQSGSSDNLSEGPKVSGALSSSSLHTADTNTVTDGAHSCQQEKGGFFSGILRKSPKIPGEVNNVLRTIYRV